MYALIFDETSVAYKNINASSDCCSMASLNKLTKLSDHLPAGLLTDRASAGI